MGHFKVKRLFFPIIIIIIIIIIISYIGDIKNMSRYKYMPAPNDMIYKIDRWSGDVYLVSPDGIKKLKEE
jgi:hypothetical protein